MPRIAPVLGAVGANCTNESGVCSRKLLFSNCSGRRLSATVCRRTLSAEATPERTVATGAIELLVVGLHLKRTDDRIRRRASCRSGARNPTRVLQTISRVRAPHTCTGCPECCCRRGSFACHSEFDCRGRAFVRSLYSHVSRPVRPWKTARGLCGEPDSDGPRTRHGSNATSSVHQSDEADRPPR